MVGGAMAHSRVSQKASASGRVTVDEVDLEGKYVRLSNKADQVRVYGARLIMPGPQSVIVLNAESWLNPSTIPQIRLPNDAFLVVMIESIQPSHNIPEN